MKKIIAAGLMTGVALLSAAPAHADVNLTTVCQRLNAQPGLDGVSNVVATLSMNTRMSGNQIRDMLLLAADQVCPRHRAVIESYFGL